MRTDQSRPYRSHKHPACNICRKRKVRCLIESLNSPCRLCRERGYQCSSIFRDTFQKPNVRRNPESNRLKKDRSLRSSVGTREVTDETDCRDETSLLMNPPMAEDITIVQESMTSKDVPSTRVGHLTSRYKTLSKDQQMPIVYLRVPRWRAGRPQSSLPGQTQLEVMEQVLRGDTESIMDLFFNRISPCFPVVSETLNDSDDKGCPALLCTMYAISSLYWSNDGTMGQLEKPDMGFLWNQAVIALDESFRAPTISTVQASLIAMIGRPVLGIQGNVLDSGRTVALAQGLGLHRNPNQWNIPSADKDLRIYIWWGVLINDTWSSLAHGTPPLIQAGCHDVPLPEDKRHYNSSVVDMQFDPYFRSLCKLTNMLARILPIVYTVEIKEGASKHEELKQIEQKLSDWELDLPEVLNPIKSESSPRENGSSGLWFLYLILKLLVCRLELKGIKRRDSGCRLETQDCHALIRKAALEAILYIISLSSSHLREFWLPYTAHLLVLATTMLLRCIAESVEPSTRKTCVEYLGKLRTYLLSAKLDDNWELGDFTLDRCGPAIEHLISNLQAETDTPLHGSLVEHQLSPANSQGEFLLLDSQFTDFRPDVFDSTWYNGLDFLDPTWSTG